MRPAIALSLAAGVGGFALVAYLFAYATTRHDPVVWQTGDLVFQTSRSGQSQAMLEATGSPLTHVGIVAVSADGVATVVEAGAKVREVPVGDFIEQGKNAALAVYRVKDATPQAAQRAVEAARSQIGKPYDIFFRKDQKEIYSSELVRLAFEAAGVELGHMERFERLATNLKSVKSLFDRRWTSQPDCKARNFNRDQCWGFVMKQQIVTPASIASDEHVVLVYSDMPTVQARRAE